MITRIFLILVGIVALDLWLLIKMGQRLGLGLTLVLVIGTGLLGIGLVKSQGFILLNQGRLELIRGRMPARPLVNGAVVLIGAIFLITPGLLGDLVGLILVIPLTRQLVVKTLRRWWQVKYSGELVFKLLSRGRVKK